jgi:hypothetical protein
MGCRVTGKSSNRDFLGRALKYKIDDVITCIERGKKNFIVLMSSWHFLNCIQIKALAFKCLSQNKFKRLGMARKKEEAIIPIVN